MSNMKLFYKKLMFINPVIKLIIKLIKLIHGKNLV